jgi:short-subunit dehydrogenase
VKKNKIMANKKKNNFDGDGKEKAANKIKYALVTGATSGIGYEIAKKLAQNGYNLILVARDEQQLNKARDEFRQYNIEATALSKDLFNRNAAKEIFDYTRQMGISVDVLVNDAGQGEYGRFVETDLKRQLAIIQLNVSSLVSLTYYFLKDMILRNEGRILQLGSEVSKIPMPFMSVYAATKAFVLSFSEALINELKDTNVGMTLLLPGATDTDFFDKAGMEDTKIYREGKLESPEEVAALAYDALMKGERRIIGPNAKMNLAMAAVTPDNVTAERLAKQMQPSEKNSDEIRHEPAHEPSLEEKHRMGSEK